MFTNVDGAIYFLSHEKIKRWFENSSKTGDISRLFLLLKNYWKKPFQIRKAEKGKRKSAVKLHRMKMRKQLRIEIISLSRYMYLNTPI